MGKEIIEEQVKVPAQMNYLRVLRKFVSRVGSKYGFSSRELYAFKASVDEACTNIIEHGYGHKDGSITIRAIVKNESFTIELVDQGKSFDPKQVGKPDINKYVKIGKKGGLGIFIMYKLLDEIDYKTTKDGNILRLTKFRKLSPQQDVTVPVSSALQKLKSFLGVATPPPREQSSST